MAVLLYPNSVLRLKKEKENMNHLFHLGAVFIFTYWVKCPVLPPKPTVVSISQIDDEHGGSLVDRNTLAPDHNELWEPSIILLS